ncbi:MAG: ABC transporter permease [Acidimicrobiales bacterium]|jgi:ABC-2 type transport system permease protein
MSLGIDQPASSDSDSDPERPTIIGGSTRFVPGQSHDRITIVNGKVQLGQRLVDLWRNRDLLILLTRTELKVKYKESVLGYAWSMLNPALVLAIYYMIFKVISRTPQPHFAIWLFCGLIVWNLFNNSAMGSTTVVVGKAGIIKKVAFPRELLAMSTVGVAIVLFTIQLVVLVIFLVGFQLVPDLSWLWLLPPAFITLLVFTAAVSVFLSAVNVYLRDTQHLTEVALMAWFWLTPIVYPFGKLEAPLARYHLTWAYLANPIAPIAMTFQRVIYAKTSYVATVAQGNTHHLSTPLLPTYGPGWYLMMLGIVFVVSIGLFLLSLIVFGRLEGNFAEEL